VCFGGMRGHEIFFYKDLKESMLENLKQKLASPELPVKRNKYLKSIINVEIYMPILLHLGKCDFLKKLQRSIAKKLKS
jgi:hypothetical protein